MKREGNTKARRLASLLLVAFAVAATLFLVPDQWGKRKPSPSVTGESRTLEAVANFNYWDAQKLGINRGDKIKISSRRGTITLRADVNGRVVPGKGSIFVPFFDSEQLVNLLTLDSFCPISKEPDYKKCAVRVERA